MRAAFSPASVSGGAPKARSTYRAESSTLSASRSPMRVCQLSGHSR